MIELNYAAYNKYLTNMCKQQNCHFKNFNYRENETNKIIVSSFINHTINTVECHLVTNNRTTTEV